MINFYIFSFSFIFIYFYKSFIINYLFIYDNYINFIYLYSNYILLCWSHILILIYINNFHIFCEDISIIILLFSIQFIIEKMNLYFFLLKNYNFFLINSKKINFWIIILFLEITFLLIENFILNFNFWF